MATRDKRLEAGKYRAQRQSLQTDTWGSSICGKHNFVKHFKDLQKNVHSMGEKVITSSLAQRNSSQEEWAVFQQVN